MAEFDIASKVVPPKFDPLAIATQAQGLQAQLLQNKILGQQAGSAVSMGRAFGSAIGSDGLDPDKVPQYYAQHPDEAQYAPAAIQAAQAQKQQQLQTAIAKLGLTKEQIALSQQELGNGAMVGQGILANGTKDPSALTKEGIATAITDNLLKPGLVKTPDGIQHAQDFISHLTDDPAQNAKLVQQWVNQSTDITKAMGAVQNVDTGGHIVQQQINPATAVPTVTGQIDKTRSPSEKANLVPVYDPATKTTKLVPSGQIIGDQPAAPNAPPAPQAGPALGDAAAAQTNVDQASTLQKRASIVPQRKAALGELVATLEKFTPGPKANLTGTINGLSAQFGIPISGATTGRAAQDTFNKLAAQIALDQWGALGGTGSNEQLATTTKANPNETMSKMGIRNVAALLQGNEDAIGAQYSAWQKYKAVHGAASYDKFQEGWNRYFDPRVFQAQHMTASARKEMLGSLSEAERKTFARDEAIAKQAGWL